MLNAASLGSARVCVRLTARGASSVNSSSLLAASRRCAMSFLRHHAELHKHAFLFTSRGGALRVRALRRYNVHARGQRRSEKHESHTRRGRELVVQLCALAYVPSCELAGAAKGLATRSATPRKMRAGITPTKTKWFCRGRRPRHTTSLDDRKARWSPFHPAGGETCIGFRCACCSASLLSRVR